MLLRFMHLLKIELKYHLKHSTLNKDSNYILCPNQNVKIHEYIGLPITPQSFKISGFIDKQIYL